MKEENNKNLALLILSILVVVFIVLCVSLYFAKGKAEKTAAEYKDAYEELLEKNENAEQAERDKEKQLAQYESDMKAVVDLMREGALVTENCANLMQNVWHNCIYQIADPETDKYTLDSSGDFYEDFNDALNNLYMDEHFVSDYQTISDNQAKVTIMIRNLKNPPEEWKDAYSDLIAYYDSYYDFMELVLHNSYSLNEFTEKFKEYDNESYKRFQKMNLYLE